MVVTHEHMESLPIPAAHDYVVYKTIWHSAGTVDLYIKFFPSPSPVFYPLNSLVNSLAEQ